MQLYPQQAISTRKTLRKLCCAAHCYAYEARYCQVDGSRRCARIYSRFGDACCATVRTSTSRSLATNFHLRAMLRTKNKWHHVAQISQLECLLRFHCMRGLFTMKYVCFHLLPTARKNESKTTVKIAVYKKGVFSKRHQRDGLTRSRWTQVGDAIVELLILNKLRFCGGCD